MLLIDGLKAHLALDLLKEHASPDCAGLAERTDSDSTENRTRAWPDDGEHGKAPEKLISSAAGADARTACTADYSGDHADACRRPGRPSDAVTAGTTEYLPMRDTADNDRPTAVDRQQDVGSTRQALTDAATDRFDAYSAKLPNCSNIELSLQNDDTTRSDIHGKTIFNVHKEGTYNMTGRRTETRQTEEKTTDRQNSTTETGQKEHNLSDTLRISVRTAPPSSHNICSSRINSAQCET